MIVGGRGAEWDAGEIEVGLSGHEQELGGRTGFVGAWASLHLPLQTRWIVRRGSSAGVLVGREDV